MIETDRKRKYLLGSLLALFVIMAVIMLMVYEDRTDTELLKGIQYGGIASTGAGLFGACIVPYLWLRNPKNAKTDEIKEKDERMIQLNHRAKARSFDISLILLIAVLIILTTVGVDLYVTIILCVMGVAICLSYVVLLWKYDREL